MMTESSGKRIVSLLVFRGFSVHSLTMLCWNSTEMFALVHDQVKYTSERVSPIRVLALEACSSSKIFKMYARNLSFLDGASRSEEI